MERQVIGKQESAKNKIYWSYDLRNQIVDFENRDFDFCWNSKPRSIAQSFTESSKTRLLQFLRKYKTYYPGNEFVTTIMVDGTAGLKTLKFVGWRSNQHQLMGYLERVCVLPSYVETGQLLDSLMADSSRGIFVIDKRCHILYVNQNFLDNFALERHACIGEDIRTLDITQHTNKLFATLQHWFTSNKHWLGFIESQRHLAEHPMYELEIEQIALADNEPIFIGRISPANHKRLSQDDIYSLGNIKIPNESEMIKQALILSKDIKSCVCLSIQPDFSEASHLLQLKRLVLAIMQSADHHLIGVREEHSILIMLKSEVSDLYRKGGFAKSIRSFKRHLKSHIDDGMYRDVQNGYIGVDIYGLDDTPIDESIQHAINAMMTHDRRETNLNFYVRSQFEKSIRKRQVEKAVLDSVRSRDLDVHFQPIISLKTGKISKLEALCRFNGYKTEYTVQELISTAENLGVIHAIDKIVCHKAMNQFQAMIERSTDKIGLTVNCSLADEEQGIQYLGDMYRLIEHSEFRDAYITIEITESNYFGGALENSELINAIRRSGIGVAVDDFGTGSSSFSYFNDFAFDVLKIDRKFIQDIHLVKQKYFAVKMLTELSHTLGVEVVAEGVELKEELDVLLALGVDYVQGYLFSRPLPLDAFMEVSDIKEVLKYELKTSA